MWRIWRGLVVAVVGCVSGVLIQKYIVRDAAARVALIDYENVNAFALGGAMGAAAILGELPNSFAKRRFGIKPGATTRGPLALLLYIWDQIDLLTTVWPALLPWIRPDVRVVAASFILALTIHPLLSLLGYLLGARKTPR